MTALATFDHVLYVPNFLQRDYFVVPEESPEPPQALDCVVISDGRNSQFEFHQGQISGSSVVLFACPATDDFFRSRINHMIDLRHPLAVLTSRMPWQEIEARVAQVFSRRGRAGVAMPHLDLFGEQVQRAAVPSNAGRPRVPLRIMIALLYLKHAFKQSDEGVVERWGETPTWQFFSGQAYFEHRRPCDATTLIKFRQFLAEEGVEELLAQTINVAVDLKLIKSQELARVIVDSTVQHKAIAHTTDSRLLETARAKLVAAAKDAGVDLKQNFSKEGKELGRKGAGPLRRSPRWSGVPTSRA